MKVLHLMPGKLEVSQNKHSGLLQHNCYRLDVLSITQISIKALNSGD